MTERDKKAYEAGCYAVVDKKQLTDNPYDNETDEHDWWEFGWKEVSSSPIRAL